MPSLQGPRSQASRAQTLGLTQHHGRGGHFLHLYEDEAFLQGAVASFIAAGLHVRQPGIVIANPSNCDAFRDRLSAEGFDLEALERSGELTFLDARDTLSHFMVDAMPDAALFRQCIGPVIRRSLQGRENTIVRAFGEMVDVLWRDGKPTLQFGWKNAGISSPRSISFRCSAGTPWATSTRPAMRPDSRKCAASTVM
jgi:MEDS: MEthanogen/methylotroph, DcmR Sensory domain